MAEIEQRKIAIHTDRIIQRKIKTNRRISSSSSVKVELQNELNIIISKMIIRRRTHKVGLFDGVTRQKIICQWRETTLVCPNISRKVWNHVVWSDESNFNFG